jgi:hypothetical protein
MNVRQLTAVWGSGFLPTASFSRRPPQDHRSPAQTLDRAFAQVIDGLGVAGAVIVASPGNRLH